MLNKYSSKQLLLFGTITATFATIIYFLILLYLDPVLTSQYFSLIVTNTFIGRVPSISLGLSLDLGLTMSIFMNFIAEALLVLFIYCGFLYSLDKVSTGSWASKQVDKFHKIAVKYKPKIDKFGAFGLLLFVFMPFWMTGPAVGIILGHLMELSMKKNLIVVFTAEIFALFTWAIVLNFFIEYVQFLIV